MEEGKEVEVIVQGIGEKKIKEIYIIKEKIEKEIRERGMKINSKYIGKYLKQIEMVGEKMKVMEMESELKEMIDVEVR